MRKDYAIIKRRTFTIISDSDSGENISTQKFLLFGGTIVSVCEVKNNNIPKIVTPDFMDIEKQHR